MPRPACLRNPERPGRPWLSRGRAVGDRQREAAGNERVNPGGRPCVIECHAMSCLPCLCRCFAVPFLHVVPPSRSVPPSGCTQAAGLLLRAYPACAPASACARLAPARFAHLIARARRRTHFSWPLPPGLFWGPSRSPAQKSRKAARKPPLYTYHTPFSLQSSPLGEIFQISVDRPLLQGGDTRASLPRTAIRGCRENRGWVPASLLRGGATRGGRHEATGNGCASPVAAGPAEALPAV